MDTNYCPWYLRKIPTNKGANSYRLKQSKLGKTNNEHGFGFQVKYN